MGSGAAGAKCGGEKHRFGKWLPCSRLHVIRILRVNFDAVDTLGSMGDSILR